jgi:hypothetical protein
MDQQPNFDFIMNPGKQRNPRAIMNSKKQRIIVVGVGIALLLVITIIVSGILSSAANKSSNQVLDLIAYQSELKRVIALGNEKARSTSTKNKSLTASYTLETHYQQTSGMIAARGIKPPKDLLGRYVGSQTDVALDAASKANNFDEKYEAIYAEKLTKYRAKLTEIYPSLNKNEQIKLVKFSDDTKLLLGEATEEPTTN